MIQNLDVAENKISFKVVLTTPACPLKEVIKNNCIEVLEETFGRNIVLDIHMTLIPQNSEEIKAFMNFH